MPESTPKLFWLSSGTTIQQCINMWWILRLFVSFLNVTGKSLFPIFTGKGTLWPIIWQTWDMITRGVFI
ncbi:hypothetical protein LINPERHAP1_LOCUS39117 [Linum perenne]